MLNLIGLKIGHLKIDELVKSVYRNILDQVVVQTNVDQTLGKGCLVQLGDQVVSGLKGLESKVVQAVKVSQVAELVVADVQPDERARNEGVVEPLEAVAGHVEPVEVAQMRHEAVEVAEVVFVQPQSSQLLHLLKRCSLDDLQIVPGQVEHVESGRNVGEGFVAQLVQLVAGEAQSVQAVESGEASFFDDLDLVVGQVHHLQVVAVADKGRD